MAGQKGVDIAATYSISESRVSQIKKSHQTNEQHWRGSESEADVIIEDTLFKIYRVFRSSISDGYFPEGHILFKSNGVLVTNSEYPKSQIGIIGFLPAKTFSSYLINNDVFVLFEKKDCAIRNVADNEDIIRLSISQNQCMFQSPQVRYTFQNKASRQSRKFFPYWNAAIDAHGVPDNFKAQHTILGREVIGIPKMGNTEISLTREGDEEVKRVVKISGLLPNDWRIEKTINSITGFGSGTETNLNDISRAFSIVLRNMIPSSELIITVTRDNRIVITRPFLNEGFITCFVKKQTEVVRFYTKSSRPIDVS